MPTPLKMKRFSPGVGDVEAELERELEVAGREVDSLREELRVAQEMYRVAEAERVAYAEQVEELEHELKAAEEALALEREELNQVQASAVLEIDSLENALTHTRSHVKRLELQLDEALELHQRLLQESDHHRQDLPTDHDHHHPDDHPDDPNNHPNDHPNNHPNDHPDDHPNNHPNDHQPNDQPNDHDQHQQLQDPQSKGKDVEEEAPTTEPPPPPPSNHPSPLRGQRVRYIDDGAHPNLESIISKLEAALQHEQDIRKTILDEGPLELDRSSPTLVLVRGVLEELRLRQAVLDGTRARESLYVQQLADERAKTAAASAAASAAQSAAAAVTPHPALLFAQWVFQAIGLVLVLAFTLSVFQSPQSKDIRVLPS